MALRGLLQLPGPESAEQAGRALDPLEAQVLVLWPTRGLDPLEAQVLVPWAPWPDRGEAQVLVPWADRAPEPVVRRWVHRAPARVPEPQPGQAVERSVACRQAPIHSSGQGSLIGRGLCGCP